MTAGRTFLTQKAAHKIKEDRGKHKPVGIDLEEQKITLPLLGALGTVSAEEAAAVRKKVMDIHECPEYKDEVREFVRSNGGVEYAAAVLDEYVAKAKAALSVLPDSKEKEYLVRIAGFTAYRKN